MDQLEEQLTRNFSLLVAFKSTRKRKLREVSALSDRSPWPRWTRLSLTSSTRAHSPPFRRYASNESVAPASRNHYIPIRHLQIVCSIAHIRFLSKWPGRRILFFFFFPMFAQTGGHQQRQTEPPMRTPARSRLQPVRTMDSVPCGTSPPPPSPLPSTSDTNNGPHACTVRLPPGPSPTTLAQLDVAMVHHFTRKMSVSAMFVT